MGRKSKYETHVKPHLKEIKEYTEQGATIAELAEWLGVCQDTLFVYQKKYPEFSEALACGRAGARIHIKAALFKAAVGYQYEEIKETTRNENGKIVTSVEKTTKTRPPSETAAAMILRNIDKDWIDHDATETNVKKRKQKLAEEIGKANNFGLELEENGNN